jgi:hypothetical protein
MILNTSGSCLATFLELTLPLILLIFKKTLSDQFRHLPDDVVDSCCNKLPSKQQKAFLRGTHDAAKR